MNSEIRELKVTHESWRPKFYGLVREGRKFRISSAGVRTVIWVIGLLITAIQVYSVLQPKFKKNREAMFAPPQMKLDQESIYVPATMDARREAEIERRKKNSGL